MPASDWTRVKRGSGKSDAKAIPINAIIAHYNGEIKEGRAANVKCFIHNDKHQSAVVNTYDNLYYCHTCGKGGNAVSLVMIMEEMGFKDALSKAQSIAVGSGEQVRGRNKRRSSRISSRTWNI